MDNLSGLGKLLLAVILGFASSLAAPATRNQGDATVIKSGGTEVKLDPAFGAVTSIQDSVSGVSLRPPEGMGESFRLVILKPDKSVTTILGRDQKPPVISAVNDKASLFWSGPLTDSAGAKYDIKVRISVNALRGGVRFQLALENKSPFKVREAQYGFVGGLSSFGRGDASLWVPTSRPWQKQVSSGFGAASFAYPGQMCMSFCCVQSPSTHKALYFSSEDEVARRKEYQFEELASKTGEKSLFASVRHSPFTPPGGRFDGSPIVLKFVSGDWRAAGNVYRAWFKQAFGITQPAQCWIRNESFFVMTMFMLPEGTINFTFKDIPKWARAAKACGINSLQISGWQMGGHDNGYPYYTPDPRLGTWKDLEAGIRFCHKLGQKVYFFVNYGQATMDTDWYKRELYKYREIDANGRDTSDVGFGMGTLWARMGHPKLMSWIDLSFPAFQKIIVDSFVKLAQIGADGVHVDKMFPTGIEYNPRITASPDTASLEGAIDLTKKVMTACRKVQPDWAMSFECNWDRLLQFTGSTWWVGNQLITRQVFPENAETLGLYDAWNFLGVNYAVREGHTVMVAPLNFSRAMDWPPFQELGRYIKEVKRIRDSLQQTVYQGEVMGQTGFAFKQGPDSGVEYNVFKNRQDGKRVCIMTNSSMTPAKVAIQGFAAGNGTVRIHVPFRKAVVVKLPAMIAVPPERVIFVEEMPGKLVGGHGTLPVQKPVDLRSIEDELKSKPQGGPINGDFETGDFTGWTADPTWVIADDSRRYYSGWHGKYWAWSGGKGEPATGVLKSRPFVLNKDGVSLFISGWNSINGTGGPRKWNYVALYLADGTELDRVYAPNTTSFVQAFLDGRGHKGAQVYVKAVDDADQATYSMLCVDDVKVADLPGYLKKPAPVAPAFDEKTSLKLENDRYRLIFSRLNGSLTGIRDLHTGQDLILEPRLAGSYKFALPIPGKERWQTIEANWIFGKDQKLSSYRVDSGKLTLTWNGPLKNYLGKPYDVSVEEAVTLGSGGPVFKLTIDNRTSLPVGETSFPIIGGIQGLGSTRLQLRATQMARPAADGGIGTTDIFRTFSNYTWLGDQGPEQWYSFPQDQIEPWVGFGSDRAGRAVCIGEQGPRRTVIHLELFPSGSGTVREDGNWPRPAELHGMPVGVELSFVDIVGGPAHQPYASAPVFLQFVKGIGPEMRRAYTEAQTGKGH
jgi:hypothetical protein